MAMLQKMPFTFPNTFPNVILVFFSKLKSGVSVNNISRYHYLLGAQEALLGNAIKNDVENTMDYKNRFENSQFKIEYENVKRIIEANNFQQTCRNIFETERRSLDFPWFQVSSYALVFSYFVSDSFN